MKKNIIVTIILFLSSFLLGYFIASYKNTNYTKYQFIVSEEIISKVDINKINNKDYLINYKNNINNPNYNNIKEEKIIENNDLIIKDNIIEVKTKYFSSILNAKGFIGNAIKYLDIDNIEYNNIFESYKEINKINPYIYSSYYLIIGSVSSILYILLNNNKNKNMDNNLYDNKEVYKTPFHKSYWIKSKNEFNNVKNLTTISILFAMMIALKSISIPTGFGFLTISPVFIVFAIISLLYGPIVGMTIGFFSDILGFFLFPQSGLFFPGYTLNAVLSGLIYGLFFYKTKITFIKVFLSRIIINIIINTILGSYWYLLLYSKEKTFEAYKVYLIITSLPKNLIFLLPQSILLFIIIKSLVPIFNKNNLINHKIASNITIF